MFRSELHGNRAIDNRFFKERKQTMEKKLSFNEVLPMEELAPVELEDRKSVV